MLMTVDVCPSPALYPYYEKEGDIVIVADIFRASTTICAMLQNGASAVIPVADIAEAQRYKSEGYWVGAERNARKCDFADGGNSPFDYPREKVEGKEVVFTTTNGTQAIEKARNCRQLFVGAFSNLQVLTEKCLSIGGRVVVICAGWQNKINIEDMLFGGAFAERLSEKSEITIDSDAVRIALELWRKAKNNPLGYVKDSDHYRRLVANGADGDVPYCLQSDTVHFVPCLDKADGKLKI